jgi:diadenosine tetraphosphatase ApaH/serine/threonine PP2A family protein phosphatase/Ca2+-binding EF-hand superfamily protein
MGCKQSTEKAPQVKTASPTPAVTTAKPSATQVSPQCPFCKKRILEKEYNAHTVMCDAREVACWNSWCRKIVKQGSLTEHMEECAKLQRTLCSKCGEDVLVAELQGHRDGCHLVACPLCPEKVIARIAKYCPKKVLSGAEITTGPFASEALRTKYLKDNTSQIAHVSHGVAKIQLLWRWAKARIVVEETLFRLIHKEMDLKKEGFAIFKAHDKMMEAQFLAPKRSKSVLSQHQVPPMTGNHYFPTSSSVPITVDHIKRMIKDFANHILLPYNAAWRVFNDTVTHLNTLPTVQRISPSVGARIVNGRVAQGAKTVVVGDLHGQLSDLLHILREGGFPDETTNYVFNGDFVDRGPYGVEVLLILFSLMLACPKYVALNRGNHECDYMNEEYGFDVEVTTKYDRNIFRLIQRCFCALPLATLVGTKVLVVHGGIPRRRDATIEDISRIQRFRQIPMPEHSQPEEDEIFQDLLWSDPQDAPGWKESDRGAGVEFGSDVTESFLANNGLELIVRSHQEYEKGYDEHHNKKLVTVFSASNYNGPDTNYGAFTVLVGEHAELSFHTYQCYDDDFETFQDDSHLTPLSTANKSFAASFTSSSSSGRVTKRRTREEVMRILRDRIFQRRHRLLAYFAKLDRSQKGSVWKIEWVEAMRNVLNMDLPWYFLRHYLANHDAATSRIQFVKFLGQFHSNIVDLWKRDWEEGMLLKVRLLHNSKPRHLDAFSGKETVNYNEFCSILRTIDHTLSDGSLFEFFLYFDRAGRSVICGPKFIDEVMQANNQDCNPLGWDLDAMEQLQNVVIQGRQQIVSLFKSGTSGKSLNEERFMNGLEQLARGMKRQLTQKQRKAIFDRLRRNQEEITFDDFISNFSIFNQEMIRRPSQSEFGDNTFAPSQQPSSPNANNLRVFPQTPSQ